VQDSRSAEVTDRIRAAKRNLEHAQNGRMDPALAMDSAVVLLTSALEWAE